MTKILQYCNGIHYVNSSGGESPPPPRFLRLCVRGVGIRTSAYRDGDLVGAPTSSYIATVLVCMAYRYVLNNVWLLYR